MNQESKHTRKNTRPYKDTSFTSLCCEKGRVFPFRIAIISEKNPQISPQVIEN